MSRKEELKNQILELTREYYQEVHAPQPEFHPGETFVNYGGRSFDLKERVDFVGSLACFLLATGPWGTQFEKRFVTWQGGK